MKKTIHIIVLAALCLNFQARAQIKYLSTGLKIGDQVPDVTLNNLINYPTKSTKISDFKDKLLILDFWATWCSSCIQNFPKLFALSKKFQDRLQVLLISSKNTRDGESTVKTFFNKRRSAYQFPCAINDTSLIELFPHQTIPHYVIIKNNRVKAITDGETITEANIIKLINNNDFKVFEKIDKKYNNHKPLFIDGNGGEQPPLLFRSLITGYVNNINGSSGFIRNNMGFYTGIHGVNLAVITLYTIAYPEYSNYVRDRIIIRGVANKNRLLDSALTLDYQKSLYTYECDFPPTSKQLALAIMRIDLDRYFNLKLDTQYKDTLCYVLKTNKKIPPRKVSTEVKSETNIEELSALPKYFTNFPISFLRSELEEIYQIPFFDETNFTSNVDFSLPSDILNIKQLSESLYRQGFTITAEKRKVGYLILSPKTFPQ